MFRSLRSPEVLATTLLAAGILVITMGTRQTLGLLVSPINSATGLGIATISLAMAVGQFTWGLVQPVAGALSDRYGPRPVLLVAVLSLAIGVALLPFMQTGWGLVVAIGLFTQMGAGAAGFSVLIGAAAQRLPAHARGAASGVINAGGSFGQFLFAPVLQKLIQSLGWVHATLAMALTALAALPLVFKLTRPGSAVPAPEPGQGAMHAIRSALRDRSYLLLHLGFFTCGFHIAFLVTHLPGEVDLCGLPPAVAGWSLAIIGLTNIAGSPFAGHWVSRHRSKYVLAAMYASRALWIAGYLLLPSSAWTFYVFAAGIGFTWLATVPPTAALVGKLFGVRYLGTLFGLTLLSHQTGGFFGAWLGGLVRVELGDFTWMWYADMVLALLAALVHLPIREARVQPAAQPA